MVHFVNFYRFSALSVVLSGCADSLFVSNVPDYLANNDRAHVTILSGGRDAPGRPAAAQAAPALTPEMMQAMVMAMVAAMQQNPAVGTMPAGYAPPHGGYARHGDAAAAPQPDVPSVRTGETAPASVKKSGWFSSLFSSGNDAAANDNVAPVQAPSRNARAFGPLTAAAMDGPNAPARNSDRDPAAAASAPADGSAGSAPHQDAGIAAPAAKESGGWLSSIFSRPKKSGGDDAAALADVACEPGEVATKMHGGSFACCPNGGSECYPPADSDPDTIAAAKSAVPDAAQSMPERIAATVIHESEKNDERASSADVANGARQVDTAPKSGEDENAAMPAAAAKSQKVAKKSSRRATAGDIADALNEAAAEYAASGANGADSSMHAADAPADEKGKKKSSGIKEFFSRLFADPTGGANCEPGEVLSKMRGGDFACCPENGDFCYALPGRSAPEVCGESESLTKMRSGIYACCPRGGNVCYKM